MKMKEEIGANWLPRDTGILSEEGCQYIQLVNFNECLEAFSN